jgi:hypothetical protein
MSMTEPKGLDFWLASPNASRRLKTTGDRSSFSVFGRNEALYKFAPGKSLLPFAEQNAEPRLQQGADSNGGYNCSQCPFGKTQQIKANPGPLLIGSNQFFTPRLTA